MPVAHQATYFCSTDWTRPSSFLSTEKASLRSAENVREMELALSNQQSSPDRIGNLYDRAPGGPDSCSLADIISKLDRRGNFAQSRVDNGTYDGLKQETPILLPSWQALA
ncbi:MAG: hypothetical protein Q9224_003517 [Gallowayella concinna]